MFYGFPSVSLADLPDAIDEKFELKDPNGCVNTVSFASVETIRLTYPALCHLLHLSKGASKNRAAFGHLYGLQISGTVTVTDTRANPLKKPSPQEYETFEEHKQRQELEREKAKEAFAALNMMFEDEMLDSYQVGCFVVGNATYNPYSQILLTQLMDLSKSSQPCVMLNYDPFRTALFGKPYLRGFVPTDAYFQYDQMMGVKGMLKARAIRESKLTLNGVLREVPVQIELDPYHSLGLMQLTVPHVQDTFLAIQSPIVEDYVEALVSSLSSNASNLAGALEKERRQQVREQDNTGHGSLAQSVETLLALQHLQEQAEHAEAICNSVLMNTSLLRDL